MGHQIIKQPDGRYAIFSSVVDSFVLIDATPEDIVAYELERQARIIRQNVDRTIAELEAGGKPYSQFTMTWEQALATHKRIHGEPFDLEVERQREVSAEQWRRFL